MKDLRNSSPYRSGVVLSSPQLNPNLFNADGTPRGPLCEVCSTPILTFEMEVDLEDEDIWDTVFFYGKKWCLPCRVLEPYKPRIFR